MKKEINPMAVVGTVGNGATVSSVVFSKTPQERELLGKMKQSMSTPLNKVIKSNKLR